MGPTISFRSDFRFALTCRFSFEMSACMMGREGEVDVMDLIYGLISATMLLGSADAPMPASGPGAETTASSSSTDSFKEARRFFEVLVERYRNLTSYSDLSRIVQVIQHAGEAEARRVETQMSSEVADGSLRTETALMQIRRTFGLELPLPKPEPLSRAELRYQLWMLPHLTLKFADQPLREFRDGVHEGFTATELTAVTVNDRPLMHLELRSGDGMSDDAAATFDLYVDPESMLIERVHGQQRLPDGGNYETTIEITPRTHEPDDSPPDGSIFADWLLRPDDAADGDGRGDTEATIHVRDETPLTPDADQPAPAAVPYPYPCPYAVPSVVTSASESPCEGGGGESDSTDEPKPCREPDVNPELPPDPPPLPLPRPAPDSSGDSSDDPSPKPDPKPEPTPATPPTSGTGADDGEEKGPTDAGERGRAAF